MDEKTFEKMAGFAALPTAAISGDFAVYSRLIEADLKCHLCGTHILLRIKGDTTNYDERKAKAAVMRSARKKHDCPAIRAHLAAKHHKYYADLRRGKEKKQEIDYRLQQAGIDTRDNPINLKKEDFGQKNNTLKIITPKGNS